MNFPTRLPIIAMAWTCLCLAVPSPLRSNPADGVVSFGGAEILGGNGHLSIRQTTDRAIINWGDFSIKRGELTEFLQPGKDSAILNRVISANPSTLDGALKANGKVFLINPNGILVGPSGTIDVGGLVLSTLDVTDDEFIAGKDMIFRGTSGASVVNYGRISAIEGDVFLIGNSVANYGSVSAPNGTVGMGAGSEVLISAEPDQNGERVFVRAAAGPRGANGVENAGTIEAAAVELKAHGNLYALAINNSGSIRATGVKRSGGQVYLRAVGGNISNTGSIAATVPGSRGGKIFIESTNLDLGGSLTTDPEGDITLLSRVNLLPGATINGQKLDDVLIGVNDPDRMVPTDEMLREGAGHSAGMGTSIDRRTGTISRGGSLADGPASVVASEKDGKILIGMPGVANRPTLDKPVATAGPTAAPVMIQDRPRPTQVRPDEAPMEPAGGSATEPNPKPPVTVPIVTPPPGNTAKP
ncbi:MAG: filamentous hemagglutinin N-terminal domain-containing protein [Verrucomicrobiae bacterium]|nr:filamentous hemagglutinin N-terminal domain-containing protein [Verrucomicrobiae bacterium]